MVTSVFFIHFLAWHGRQSPSPAALIIGRSLAPSPIATGLRQRDFILLREAGQSFRFVTARQRCRRSHLPVNLPSMISSSLANHGGQAQLVAQVFSKESKSRRRQSPLSSPAFSSLSTSCVKPGISGRFFTHLLQKYWHQPPFSASPTRLRRLAVKSSFAAASPVRLPPPPSRPFRPVWQFHQYIQSGWRWNPCPSPANPACAGAGFSPAAANIQLRFMGQARSAAR
ncbi:Uncharacterised protein [Escherichia coli]|uniref:Uncharacterized protein n=1 Tax=Escherichia coli TaxID=562 RepID=A0A376LHF0_ECOLX|nr:Uncharacterised protein [Escherichia coli]